MLVVFGSINMDVSVRVQNFPAAGETILAPAYEMFPGGKGANQAMACAKAGAKTALVGKVGDDGMGTRILNNLRRHEVMTSGVAVDESLPTGMAMITVNAKGENQIVVATGANSNVNADQVPDEVLKPDKVVLMQMEVPIEQNTMLLERAKKRGSTTILNLAPAFHVPQKMLELVDYLIVNEHEARMIADVLGMGAHQDLRLIARALATKGRLVCIVTMGAKGSIAIDAQGKGWSVPAMTLKEVVDTTGAGDCFCGTFAAAIHGRLALGSAMRRASVAAGLSCLKAGAQDSYPYLADVDAAIETFPQATAL
jgi:ribokinase